MRAFAACLAAMLLAACVSAPSSEPLRGWYDGFDGRLEEKIVGLVGAEAIDCGYVPNMTQRNHWLQAQRCIEQAQQGDRPYRMGYGSWGIDSGFDYAVGRDGNGRITLITLSIDLPNVPGNRRLSASRCTGLQFPRESPGHDYRQLNPVEATGCEVDEAMTKQLIEAHNASVDLAEPTGAAKP